MLLFWPCFNIITDLMSPVAWYVVRVNLLTLTS